MYKRRAVTITGNRTRDKSCEGKAKEQGRRKLLSNVLKEISKLERYLQRKINVPRRETKPTWTACSQPLPDERLDNIFTSSKKAARAPRPKAEDATGGSSTPRPRQVGCREKTGRKRP